MKRIIILFLALSFTTASILSQDKIAKADSTKTEMKSEKCGKDCKCKKDCKEQKSEMKKACKKCKESKADTKK